MLFLRCFNTGMLSERVIWFTAALNKAVPFSRMTGLYPVQCRPIPSTGSEPALH